MRKAILHNSNRNRDVVIIDTEEKILIRAAHPHWSFVRWVIDPITPRQLRLALLQIGITPDMVTTAIDQLDEPTKTAAMIEWEYALEVKRDHPLISQLMIVFEKTAEDVDNLFLAASEL